MAEARRIPLESVKVPDENPTEEPQKTHRFSLDLIESNEKTCPEFSYSDLVSKTSTGEKKDIVKDDLYGEDEDDKKLQDIARKFEEKYGPKGPNKNKTNKMGRWEDYIDRGLGYDESDPFIDNNEAYDELVPSTLTTQFGGFYINSGELEFRNVSESESADGMKPRKKRRRIIDKALKKKYYDGLKSEIPMVPKKRGRKPLDRTNQKPTEESALSKMRRKAQPTVAALLQERKAQLQSQPVATPGGPKPEEESPYGGPASVASTTPSQNHNNDDIMELDDDSPLAVPVICSSDENDLLDNSLDNNLFGTNELGKGELNSNINEIIESVVKNAEDILNNGNFFLSGSSDSEEVKNAIKSIDAPKLPDNMSADLIEIVHKIKQAALVTAEGKCKFFSGDVNRMLLKIEVKSRELSCTQRSMIYSHLASFLPCTKETLLKRAKKLRLDQEGGKLESPMQRLRDAVEMALPAIMDKYDAACATAKKSMGENGPDIIEMPRKKFDWSDKLRILLCEVVRIKLKCYEVLKMRTQSAQEFLYQFLDYEVKRLWPNDWMTTRILYKESRNAHAYLTSSKSKKPWLLVKKVPGAVEPGNALKPMSQEMVAASGIMALAGASSSPPAYVEELDDEEEEEENSLSSSNKLVIASPPREIEKQRKMSSDIVEVKPEAPLSPGKRIFKIMNPEESPRTPTQPSFAAQMLDRIICASLANFPNSGSTLGLPEIGGKPIKTEDVVVVPVAKVEPEPIKVSEVKSVSNSLTSPPMAVSILKSNYSQSSSGHHRTNRTTVLEHGAKQHSGVLKGGQKIPTMPFQAYEFQEAFKRSLGILPGANVPANDNNTRTISYAPAAVLTSPRQSVARKLDDEPMNFSTSSSGGGVSATVVSHYTASQELNRLAAVSLQPTTSTAQSQRTSRTHKTTEHGLPPGIVFPEGMKGFPMPLKSSNNSSSANPQPPLQPPPAHHYNSSRRTSPSEPIRPTPHSPLPTQSSNAHSPPGGGHNSIVSNSSHHHSVPYQSNSHYSAAEALSMATWQSSSGQPHSPIYSTTSQYSGGSAAQPSTATASGFPLPSSPQHQRPNVVHKSPNIPIPAHQLPQNSKPVNRNLAYNSLYPTGQYPNSQRSNQQPPHQRIP